MERSFRPYRDEMFIATKAGYDMWPGPYGNWGSRKYLTASLDQSLRRMKLDYVDIFYSHRHDPETPLEETLQALVDIVRRGKALYVGLSRYPLEAARFAFRYLAERDVPCLLFQDRYNIFSRQPETSGVLSLSAASGSGFVAFSPLAQGLLTGRSEGFGEEVKRRIMLGSFVLSSGYYDAYYLKALRTKALIKKAFDEAFAKYDVIIGPAAPTTAPKLGDSLSDPIKMYLGDIYTISVNLAGLPGISVPCGQDSNGLPIGMQIIGDCFKEKNIIRAAYTFEQSKKYDRCDVAKARDQEEQQ